MAGIGTISRSLAPSVSLKFCTISQKKGRKEQLKDKNKKIGREGQRRGKRDTKCGQRKAGKGIYQKF